MTEVKETSILAYLDHRNSGKMGRQEEIVYNYIKSHPKINRTQVSNGTGIKINAVCGRVKTLLDSGFISLSEKKRCPFTNKLTETLA